MDADDPGSTRETGERDPGGPGERDPGGPGERDPGGPGERDPGDSVVPGVETLAGLATGEDHPDAVALRTAGADPEREYDYDRLRTDARKSGNLLAALGIREGRTLGIAADPPVPEAVLALLGAGLLGAVVRFDPPSDPDARAVLVPADRVGAYDLPPGGQRVAYGGEPDDPTVTHFERAMWSENPTFPPPSVSPGDPLLATGEGTYSHGSVIGAARRLVEEFDLSPGDEVALRTPLSVPGGVVAGVVAPLLAGATVLLVRDGAAGSPAGDDATGTLAVAEGTAPEDRVVDPRSIEVGRG